LICLPAFGFHSSVPPCPEIHFGDADERRFSGLELGKSNSRPRSERGENEESTFVCFSFSLLSFGYRKDIFCAFIGENLRPDIKG
jgi:hypothetical protein